MSAGRSASAPVAEPPATRAPASTPTIERLRAAARVLPPIWIVFGVILGAIIWKRPSFAELPSLVQFVKQATPLMILALGQLFVILLGDFDLSVGFLVTTMVIVAARVSDGQTSRTYPVMLLLLALGVAVGVVNGLIRTRLNVPSIIATLGTGFVLQGAVFNWSHGSPTGALPENFRRWGRLGFTGIPGIRQLPYSVLVLLVLAALAVYTLHHTRFGRQIYATGGNPVASRLSGVNTWNIRVAAFVVSAFAAAVAGILLAGYGGVSPNAGNGDEFQAISAVVLGGAVLGGGRGTAGQVLGGALTLQALFTLMNFLGYSESLELVVQGVVIIAAAAFAAYRLRAKR